MTEHKDPNDIVPETLVIDAIPCQLKRLKKYFQGMSFQKFIDKIVDFDEIIDRAKPEDVGMLRIFCNEVLGVVINKYQKQPDKISQPFFVFDGKMDLSSKVMSLRFKSFGKTKCCTDDLITIFEKFYPPKSVSHIVLVANFLADEDIPHIRALVQQNDFRVIDLSHNSIYGEKIVSDLINMLSSPTLEHLVITNNPIFSKERLSFIKELEDNFLEKLIWIPRHQLNNIDSWLEICGVAKQKQVIFAHEKYYSLFIDF